MKHQKVQIIQASSSEDEDVEQNRDVEISDSVGLPLSACFSETGGNLLVHCLEKIDNTRRFRASRLTALKRDILRKIEMARVST